jgi:hypothetical protein
VLVSVGKKLGINRSQQIKSTFQVFDRAISYRTRYICMRQAAQFTHCILESIFQYGGGDDTHRLLEICITCECDEWIAANTKNWHVNECSELSQLNSGRLNVQWSISEQQPKKQVNRSFSSVIFTAWFTMQIAARVWKAEKVRKCMEWKIVCVKREGGKNASRALELYGYLPPPASFHLKWNKFKLRLLRATVHSRNKFFRAQCVGCYTQLSPMVHSK